MNIRALDSWMLKIELTVIADWFMAQPLFAKKMYITIVIANDNVYIASVEPIKTPRHALES